MVKNSKKKNKLYTVKFKTNGNTILPGENSVSMLVSKPSSKYPDGVDTDNGWRGSSQTFKRIKR